MSDAELQSAYRTCVSLFVNTGKAWWNPSCFHLIYLSSPLHTKHIIELGRTKEFKVVGLNETGL